MIRSFPAVAIALALLITGFLHPLTEAADAVVETRAQRYGDFRQELYDSMGRSLSVATPFIEFPGTRLRSVDGAPPRQPREFRLYPASLRADVVVRQYDVRRNGLSLPSLLADIELTAVFELPAQWDAYFPDGGPNWSEARISMPVAQPKSLSGFPTIRIDGREWRLDQSLGSHNRMRLLRDIRELPQGPVTLRLQSTATAPDIGIGARAVQANVRLLSEANAEYFSGPLPQDVRRANGRTQWLWSIDRAAYFDGVWDTTEDPREDANGGFLGIGFREPDTSGQISLSLADPYPKFSLAAGSLRFLPAIFLFAAFAAIAAGHGQLMRQVELLLAIAAGAAVTFWLTQRVDQGVAYAGGGAIATLVAAIFLAQHSRVAALLAATMIAGLWAALYHLLGVQPAPGQINYSVLPDIAQPFLITAGAGILVMVGLWRGLRRLLAR